MKKKCLRSGVHRSLIRPAHSERGTSSSSVVSPANDRSLSKAMTSEDGARPSHAPGGAQRQPFLQMKCLLCSAADKRPRVKSRSEPHSWIHVPCWSLTVHLSSPAEQVSSQRREMVSCGGRGIFASSSPRPVSHRGQERASQLR